MKRFFVPVALAAALFAITFALGRAQQCPSGFSLKSGICVRDTPVGGPAGVTTFNTRSGDVVLAGADVTAALNFTPLASLANIAVGPGNSTINGTVNVKDGTPTTGATMVNIGLGASQTPNSLTFQTQGAMIATQINYIPNETGANNAIAGSLPNLGGPTPPGVCVLIVLAHTLQAGGVNTFSLNGATPLQIYSHFGGAYIAKGYTAGIFINLCNLGSGWLDMSQ